MTVLRPPRLTELQCQATIVAAATRAGWRVHAERTARTQSGGWATPVQGHTGFPDLVCVRRGILVAVELKRKPNKVEPAQVAWLDALRQALPGHAIVGVVWVPDQMQEFIEAFTADDALLALRAVVR